MMPGEVSAKWRTKGHMLSVHALLIEGAKPRQFPNDTQLLAFNAIKRILTNAQVPTVGRRILQAPILTEC
jgi:hypothetical protein